MTLEADGCPNVPTTENCHTARLRRVQRLVQSDNWAPERSKGAITGNFWTAKSTSEIPAALHPF